MSGDTGAFLAVGAVLFILGGIVAATAVCALAVRFTHDQKAEERRLYADALNARARKDAPPTAADAVVN